VGPSEATPHSSRLGFPQRPLDFVLLLRFLVALGYFEKPVRPAHDFSARGSKLLEEITEMNASPGWRQRICELTVLFFPYLTGVSWRFLRQG
jgi:hypothetical protein